MPLTPMLQLVCGLNLHQLTKLVGLRPLASLVRERGPVLLEW